MLKCILIYLWLYCGLFYLIEAGEDDEHVHIKLHMPSGGQRKRAELHHQQAHTQHHKKRNASPPSHHHHKHYHHTLKSHPIVGPPAPPPSQSTMSSSSTANHMPQHMHENGHMLALEEENYGGDGGADGLNTNSEESLMIPSYLATNFALFPQPTTAYETEIIPHNNEGFNVVDHHYDNSGGVVLETPGLDNEITAPAVVAGHKGNSFETQFLLNEQQQQQLEKTIKNEQLLQQIFQQRQQQQHNDKREITNSASKLREIHKYRNDKGYRSEDDMKEALPYSSFLSSTSSRQPTDSDHSDTLKALTVNDIWAQLQQQYLSKYAPQAQPLAITTTTSTTTADSADEQQPLAPTTATKTRPKRKRNTKRRKQPKTTSTVGGININPESYFTSSISWPTKTLSRANNHYKQQKRQPTLQQPYYDDTHSTSLSHTSASLHTRDADLFVNRPKYNSFSSHIVTDASTEDGNDDSFDDDDDDSDAEEDFANNDDIYGNAGYSTDGNRVIHPDDESYDERVYQRGKKFTGSHTAIGHYNPFNYHDLYGSYSTPVTATVATKLQPSTYHPNLLTPSTIGSGSGSGSYVPTTAQTSAYFPTTLQHPSTSYQWRTQQNYPTSYQTYHMQHQWPAASDEARQHSHTQSSAIRSPPKATITQTPNSILATHTNDFTSPSSSTSSFDSAIRSTVQTPTAVKTSSRYKKLKNRIKTKRNRIVVI